MGDNWKTYARYKALNGLPESPLLQSLEELIQQTELYDLLEFSHKYVKKNGRYHCNPLRLSLYSSDLRMTSPFLKKGFACFSKILIGMKGASDFKKLKTSFMEFPREDLQYLVLGIEMNEHIEKSRLKIYSGYWLSYSKVSHYLLRAELSLNGELVHSRYDSCSVANSRTKLRLRNVPRELSSEFFSEVFFQGNSLHFMINGVEKDRAWKLVRKMMPARSIRDRLSTMIANGFHLFAMRVQRQEIQKNDLRSFTLYFR